jgi:hypothetical protein
MRLSTPFLSADRRAMYAIDQTGARRRVIQTSEGLAVRRRIGKAAKKAMKRARRRQ